MCHERSRVTPTQPPHGQEVLRTLPAELVAEAQLLRDRVLDPGDDNKRRTVQRRKRNLTYLANG